MSSGKVKSVRHSGWFPWIILEPHRTSNVEVSSHQFRPKLKHVSLWMWSLKVRRRKPASWRRIWCQNTAFAKRIQLSFNWSQTVELHWVLDAPAGMCAGNVVARWRRISSKQKLLPDKNMSNNSLHLIDWSPHGDTFVLIAPPCRPLTPLSLIILRLNLKLVLETAFHPNSFF